MRADDVPADKAFWQLLQSYCSGADVSAWALQGELAEREAVELQIDAIASIGVAAFYRSLSSGPLTLNIEMVRAIRSIGKGRR